MVASAVTLSADHIEVEPERLYIGAMSADATIGPVLGCRIEHRKVGAQHLFTSPDLLGLYVAHRDYDAALSGIAPAIEMLRSMDARRQEKERFRNMVAAE